MSTQAKTDRESEFCWLHNRRTKLLPPIYQTLVEPADIIRSLNLVKTPAWPLPMSAWYQLLIAASSLAGLWQDEQHHMSSVNMWSCNNKSKATYVSFLQISSTAKNSRACPFCCLQVIPNSFHQICKPFSIWSNLTHLTWSNMFDRALMMLACWCQLLPLTGACFCIRVKSTWS